MTFSLLRRRCLFAAVVTAGIASAASGEHITLADAIARARADAPEIAAATARIEAGESRLRQARAHRFPSIRMQEIWMRTDSPAEAFALELNQERFSFPDFVASDPNDPDAIESATTRLEISMPLYTGGELSNRIQQASLGADAARQRAEWSGNAAVLAAAEAFIRLAQAREYVDLLSRSLATVDAHVDLARAYTEQGMLVRSELLRAEVERANVQDMLTAAQGRARVAAANLSFRLAAQPDDEWELEALPTPSSLGMSVAEWIASARSRSDLEAARQMLQAGELEIRIQRSALRPKVGLLARHDLVDDSLFGSHGDSTAIMAVGSIDLWSGGGRRAAADAARADYEAARRDVERFADAVALDVTDGFEIARSALERHATALAAQEAARETERITEERFAQGVVKTIDVLDASTARREAETRELVARAEAHLARFNLAVRAGRRPEEMIHQATNRDVPPTAEEY